MEAVDGFEPKEVATDPLWDQATEQQEPVDEGKDGRKQESKITTLYK